MDALGKEVAGNLAGAALGGAFGLGYQEAGGASEKGVKKEAVKFAENKKKAEEYWKKHNKPGMQTKRIEGIQREADEAEGGEETRVELPPVPWDAQAKADSAAANMALVSAEREELGLRVAITNQNLTANAAASEKINAIDARASEQRGQLKGTQDVLDQQIGTANEFHAKSSGAADKGEELKKDSGQIKGAIEGQKGNIEDGAKKGESEGESDPALKEGGNAASQASQAPGAAGSAANTATAGAAAAKQMAQAGEAIKAGSEKADAQTGQLQDLAAQKQGEMANERAGLLGEREALLARLDELNAQEEEQKSAHEEGMAETEGWIADSQAVIEEHKTNVFGDEGVAEFDTQAQEMASGIADEDEANKMQAEG